MFAVLALGTAALSLLAPPATVEAVPPPPGDVAIRVVKVQGSGCRPGTATVDISGDKEAFTVVYSTYLAEAGPDSKKKDAHRDCRLRIRLDAPRGYSYTISQADYRGYAKLQNGATARQSATYYLEDEREPALKTHSFTGPFDDTWQRTDTTTAAASRAFAPCKKNPHLQIRTELSVDPGRSDPRETSYIAMDSTDGTVHKTVYRLQWSRCT
jgi:hypothetical protein